MLKENKFLEHFKGNNWSILIFQGANWLSLNFSLLSSNHYPGVHGFYPCPEYGAISGILTKIKLARL